MHAMHLQTFGCENGLHASTQTRRMWSFPFSSISFGDVDISKNTLGVNNDCS